MERTGWHASGISLHPGRARNGCVANRVGCVAGVRFPISVALGCSVRLRDLPIFAIPGVLGERAAWLSV
jgi:hypothetical protein